MPPKFYAYIYFDPRTDLPFYVGKGQNHRARKHLHQCHNLQVARRLADLKSEGIDPEIQIISTHSEDAAFDLERDLIKLYGRLINRTGHLLNIADGGEQTAGFKGHRHSEETKAKMRAAWVGRTHSPEHMAKIKAAAKKRTFSQLARDCAAAWHKSAECAAISSKRSKKSVTPDRLEDMTRRAARVNRGCKRSLEHRAAISAAVRARVITPETRAKMSAAQKRRYAK